MGEALSSVHTRPGSLCTRLCVCMCVRTHAGVCRTEQHPGPAGARWMLWGWLQEGEGLLGKQGVLAQAGGRVLPGTPIPSPSFALNFCINAPSRTENYEQFSNDSPCC